MQQDRCCSEIRVRQEHGKKNDGVMLGRGKGLHKKGNI